MSLWSYVSPLYFSSQTPYTPRKLSLGPPLANSPRPAYRSYRNLKPQTRILLGLGLMANAALMQYFMPGIEKELGLQATKEDEERLKRALPRLKKLDKE